MLNRNRKPTRKELEEALGTKHRDMSALSASVDAASTTITALTAVLATGPAGGVEIERDPDDPSTLIIRVRGLDFEEETAAEIQG